MTDKMAAPRVIPFSEATAIQRLDSHTYAANLVDTFCIGTVPNGGYVASCILQAASMHLTPRDQQGVLTSHFEYIGRTEVGPAVIIIEDVKLGRQLSTIHATLYQHALLPSAPWITPASTRKNIVAYLTMTNLQNERGISLPTAFALHPRPPPVDHVALATDSDPNWAAVKFTPGHAFGYIRCLQNAEYFTPRQGQPDKSVIDLWVRLASGEPFSNASLGYVVDCWPYVVEAYRPLAPGARDEPFAYDAVFWYPTIVLNLETKKALPEQGAQWLQLRVLSKQIRNGRLDLEVSVLDEEGELVALSHHVDLILGSERNTSGRKGKGKKASRI
ncbi:thioesterase-like superfamily-domain-containing protein [Podospora appendiculata]|uniref:Thioesterase-like superfamily-domain-containing protein n=1 Tax=Podospora appendiculata TaxID=314037 RepID=A0AAE0X758_9PEZI|nr:thioesterase-like superfamily-domain-containing protein [Podospora appendiculata]